MAAVAVLGVAAIAAPAQGRPGGTLTVLAGGDVDSADPGITYTLFGASIVAATQRTPMGYRAQDDTTPVPDLADAPPQVSSTGGR